MANPDQQFTRLLEDIKRAEYRRGWREAIAAVTASANALWREPSPDPKSESATQVSPPSVAPPKPRGRPAVALGYVLDAIQSQPGLSGVQIVDVLRAMSRPVAERTVRTCLRRLRLAHKIKQRKGLWYPTSTPTTATAETNREAPEAPPH